MSLIFGQIPSLTTELVALEHLKTILSPGFLCNVITIILILADGYNWHNILCFWINSWSLFKVQSYLPLSIVNYDVSKHNAGSQVSDRCPLGCLSYLYFHIPKTDTESQCSHISRQLFLTHLDLDLHIYLYQKGTHYQVLCFILSCLIFTNCHCIIIVC